MSRTARPASASVEVEHVGIGVTETKDSRAGDHAVDDRDRDGDPGQRVVAVPPGDSTNAVPVPGANRRKRTASTSSSWAERRLERPDEEVGARRSRGARAGPTASTTPPGSTSTAGISPAGSACAIEPTVVPRLRIVGCATLRSAWRSSGSAAYALVVALEPGVPHQRARPAPQASVTLDGVQPGDAG